MQIWSHWETTIDWFILKGLCRATEHIDMDNATSTLLKNSLKEGCRIHDHEKHHSQQDIFS